MNMMLDWWKIVWQTGQPIVPYVGIFLLAIFVVVFVVILFYIIYRIILWTPPFFRYLWWRLGSLVSKAKRLRLGQSKQSLDFNLLARWQGDLSSKPLRSIFSLNRWRFNKKFRPENPLVAVIGPAKSGKTSLLEQAVGLRSVENIAGDVDEFTWWSIQGRFFVEIPSSFCRDGASSLRKYFCNQLSDWYPERPLSAIVVLVPISLFQSTDSDSEGILQGLSDTARQFSDFVQYALPIHIVLTFTDSVPGFAAISRSSDLLEQKDVFSFLPSEYRRPRDIAINLANWFIGIQTIIMRTVVVGKIAPLQSNLHELLQFGPAIELVRPRLTTWVNSITANVSHLPNLLKIEVITFTGRVTGNASHENSFWWATPEAVQNLEFVRTPSDQFALRYIRHLRRGVALASLVLLFSLCIFAFWVPSTVKSVNESTRILMSVSTGSEQDRITSSVDLGSLSYEPARIEHFFSQIHSLDSTKTWFVLVPSSWLNGFKDILFSKIGTVIQKDFVGPAMSSLSSSHLDLPVVVVSSSELISHQRIEDLSSFRALDIFLDRQEIRGSSIKAAEKLNSGLSYRDLLVLVNDDPARISAPAWDWSKSLPEKLVEQFHFEVPIKGDGDNSTLVQPISMLTERFLVQTIEENPAFKISTEILDISDKLRRSSDTSFEDIYRLSQLFRDLQIEVERPLAGVILNKQAQSLRYVQPFISRLTNSSVVPLAHSVALSADFVKRRDIVRSRMLAMDQSFFGKIFIIDVDSERIILSPEFKKTSNTFSGLLSSPFMQQQSIALKDIDFDRDYYWQLSKLDHVRTLSSTFQQFLSTDIQNFDAVMRPQLVRLARQQYRRIVQSEFIGALTAVPSLPSLDRSAPSESLATARAQIQSLISVLRLRKQSLSIEDTNSADIVNDLLQAQSVRVLSIFERHLLQDDPYVGLSGDVLRWVDSSQVSRPLSTHVRVGVKEQLLSTREKIRNQYMILVSELLVSAETLPSSFQKEDVVRRWKKIIDAMESYEKGDANSALVEFEQYFLALSKLSNADDCVQFLSEKSDIKIRDDYFSRKLVKFDEALVDGCYARGSDGRRRSYMEFADFFNKSIAGHPPFSLPGRLQDPVSRRSFASMSDAYMSMRKRIGDAAVSAWPQPVRIFLGQMDSLMLRSSGVAPQKTESGSVAKPSQLTVRAKVIFNTHSAQSAMADQIISWSVQAGQKKYSLRNPKEIFIWEIGEPIEVQFRWASDSPFVPVAPLGEYGRYTVSDRTATFRFNSDWALFDLLRQHSAGGDPYDSVALRFEMDVVGSERRATSKAFVTLQALDGGGALELDLPTTAPSLPAKSERSGSVATSTGFAK